MQTDSKHTCRVCGLAQADAPWGEDGRTPSYNICECCGVEFGYEDSTPEGLAIYKAEWLERGGKCTEQRKPYIP